MRLTEKIKDSGGVYNMKKIKMNNITQEDLMELVLVTLEVPKEVEILGFTVGDFKTNDGQVRPWANFDCVDTIELDLLKSVGLEENASIIKFKVQDYNGEVLSGYVNKKIDVSSTSKVFVTDKNKKITGLAFRGLLESLKEVN